MGCGPVSSLSFYVHGRPAPQGSKRHVGRGILVESSKAVAPWRIDVKHAALDAAKAVDWATLDGPVAATFTFYFARPKSHFGTGRNVDNLKDSAPAHNISRASGDIDKLARSTCDALVAAGVIADDSQIVTLVATKEYGAKPGAHISITTLTGGGLT